MWVRTSRLPVRHGWLECPADAGTGGVRGRVCGADGVAMAITPTPSDALALIAGGAQVVVRDEEWLVRAVQQTPSDGLMVRCIGTSPFVRDTEATFFTNLDRIQPLRPEDTKLITDRTPNFRGSRLYLEAVIRKTPVAATETDLAVAGHQLLDELQYQRRAVHKALTGLRPRVLIADAVGLGKTLEVGMLLSELIRRGRGERILVVTPRHILEQFQHELWTRFAIPLVRLDSEGIQRVRRKIPANRNPFTYYKRVIVSIDTLKNAGRYRHHLEGIHWDAVVIDECHNLVNAGTLNNQLAKVLAPRTEALVLTSATPHNGDPASFAQLIRLLDPTAIADPAKIDKRNIEHLYIRRHKAHEEVASEVGHEWADRLEPTVVPVKPVGAEAAMFDELADTWIHPRDGQKAPTSGKGSSLFPWTLFKAALSSHRALSETVANRRRTLEGRDGSVKDSTNIAEYETLGRLGELAAEVPDGSASKLEALVSQLQDIGVGPRSATRAVVFSERIATLDWLAATVPQRLGLKPGQVRVLHGGLADVKQMDVIEEFGLAESDVRLLLTGDMASEGVNLHRQCHHLIHFDLPWSLITIEQRNGRIDRYGQLSPPDIRALVVTPDHEQLSGDVRVLSKLLQRESEAHRAFGESSSLLGLHSADAEEESITKAIRDGVDPDRIIPAEPESEFDLMAILAGGTGLEPIPERRPPSLFESDHAFVVEAMAASFDDPAALDLRPDPTDPSFLSLAPPPDLVRRLAALPQSYLTEQKVAERMKLTADPHVANIQLAGARESTDSQWPQVGYLSPLHPFLDWLVDKVLVMVGRNQAPILTAAVDRPTFCVQGMWSNGRGRPQLVEWLAISEADDGEPTIDDLFETLRLTGVGPSMPNSGHEVDPRPLEAQLQSVVTAARAELGRRRSDRDRQVDELLAGPRERLRSWVEQSGQLAFDLPEGPRSKRQREVDDVKDSTEQLIEQMRTTGDPMVRVLAVLMPSAGSV